MKLIDRYKSVLLDVEKRYEPSSMARHAIDLCQAFNKFYFENRILDGTATEQNAKLMLVKATQQVIKNELTLLGIECPEHM